MGPSAQQKEAAQPTSEVLVEPWFDSKRLMGDAIRAAGGDMESSSLAVEPYRTKKRKADKRRAKVEETSKKP
jgi:hypothetical protein